jgi:hypothetical protein
VQYRNRIKILFTLLALSVLISCNYHSDSNEWLDNDAVYLCPDCRGNYYPDMTGKCENCDGLTSSYAFKYCYSCAKELNVCQCCGVER